MGDFTELLEENGFEFKTFKSERKARGYVWKMADIVAKCIGEALGEDGYILYRDAQKGVEDYFKKSGVELSEIPASAHQFVHAISDFYGFMEIRCLASVACEAEFDYMKVSKIDDCEKVIVLYKDENKLIEDFKKSVEIKDVKELVFSGFCQEKK